MGTSSTFPFRFSPTPTAAPLPQRHHDGRGRRRRAVRFIRDARHELRLGRKYTLDIDGVNGFEEIRTVVIQSDGKIVLGGYRGTTADADFTVVRISAAGALDTGFSGDGLVTPEFHGADSHDITEQVALQPDKSGGQRIVLCGYSTVGTFAILRYTSSGTLDSSFDSDGRLSTDSIGGSWDTANALAITPDGDLVVGGWTGSNHYTGGDFALARYRIDSNYHVIPAAPTGASATPLSTTSVQLTWTDNSSIETGYNVERSADAGSTWTLLQSTAAGATTYTDTTATDGASYLYRVKATNAVGDSTAATASAAITPLIAPTRDSDRHLRNGSGPGVGG